MLKLRKTFWFTISYVLIMFTIGFVACRGIKLNPDTIPVIFNPTVIQAGAQVACVAIIPANQYADSEVELRTLLSQCRTDVFLVQHILETNRNLAWYSAIWFAISTLLNQIENPEYWQQTFHNSICPAVCGCLQGIGVVLDPKEEQCSRPL